MHTVCACEYYHHDYIDIIDSLCHVRIRAPARSHCHNYDPSLDLYTVLYIQLDLIYTIDTHTTSVVYFNSVPVLPRVCSTR